MQKNFDGIKKINPQVVTRKFKPSRRAFDSARAAGRIKSAAAPFLAPVVAHRIVPVDCIAQARQRHGRQPGRRSAIARKPAARAGYASRLFGEIGRQKVALSAAVMGLLLAFAGGAWFVLATNSSLAQSQPQVLGAFIDQPSISVAALPSSATVADSAVGAQTLFNTPLEYLKQYLANISEPDILSRRTAQIKQYLIDKNSPLASAAETIAVQPHWNIIMAVAFAESSLGKNCTDYNCSNIGVKPGSPQWRQYASYDDWVVDFNRLLDAKYKDWTLQQMCGVYVKPCNPNWLLATQQVLDQLQQEHIE